MQSHVERFRYSRVLANAPAMRFAGSPVIADRRREPARACEWRGTERADVRIALLR